MVLSFRLKVAVALILAYVQNAYAMFLVDEVPAVFLQFTFWQLVLCILFFGSSLCLAEKETHLLRYLAFDAALTVALAFHFVLLPLMYEGGWFDQEKFAKWSNLLLFVHIQVHFLPAVWCMMDMAYHPGPWEMKGLIPSCVLFLCWWVVAAVSEPLKWPDMGKKIAVYDHLDFFHDTTGEFQSSVIFPALIATFIILVGVHTLMWFWSKKMMQRAEEINQDVIDVENK